MLWVCRPVTSPLDEHAVPIGIPCAAALQPSARRFFFVRVAPDAVATAASAGGAHAPEPLPISGLELGPLLAKSPYGRTYRGFLNGSPVAVKVGWLLHHPCVLLRFCPLAESQNSIWADWATMKCCCPQPCLSNSLEDAMLCCPC